MSDSASTTRVTFAIDAKISRLTIKVTASGMLSALGHNPVVTARGFSGDVECVRDTFADAGLRFRVGANTLTVQDGIIEKDRREIERIMKDEVLETGKFPEIKVTTKMVNRTSAITGLKRVSKPGLRKYVGATEIPKVLGGMGISILSTPQGVISGREAKKQNVGGELLAYVW